ncbi:MAG: hypothetical protein HUJ54_03270 [Erysipelotrichaceae bacterium]|nr:hypothetical protein [Erysipelotrichaceae bacterium]
MRMDKQYEGLTNPGMLIAFICSVFGFLSFASAFFDLPADSLFAVGMIRLFLGLTYFMAAMVNLLNGRAVGNVNLIFSVCFGLFSGSSILVSTLHAPGLGAAQLPLFGILQIFAGLFLGCILPVMKKMPLYQWICLAAVVAALLFSGGYEITGILLLRRISGLLFLAFGLLNIYTGLSWIIPELPQGICAQALFRKTKGIK